MTPDPFTTLVDQIADQVADRIRPGLIDAVEARKLPALAVTVAEAAEALSISPDSVTRLIDDGRLTVLDGFERARRVTVASLQAYAGHPLLPQLRAVPHKEAS